MEKLLPEITSNRNAEHEISKLILNRWSPRAMSGEKIEEEEILPLLEAAKWAPSPQNSQPWRFIYAVKEGEGWEKLYGLVNESNRRWAKNAGALAVVISRKEFEHNGKPNRAHAFVTGAAMQNFLLEGTRRGLVVHPIGGFDLDGSYGQLGIPQDYEVQCMIVIGRMGSSQELEEKDRLREFPSGRKLLNRIAMRGKFDPGKDRDEIIQ